MQRFREWFSIRLAKNPGQIVLLAILLGYVIPGSGVVLFSGDQSETAVKLESGDKIIVFSNH